MPRLPNDDEGLLSWAAQRLPIWTGQGTAPEIGLSPAQLTSAQAELTAAQAAFDAAEAIRTQSLQKTLDKDQKLDALRGTLGGLITQIDGFAKATKNPGVYVLANVPEPKPKTPRSEADVPTGLTTTSQTDGSILVGFEANKGAGTVFLLQRQLVPEGGLPGAWTDGPTLTDKRWLDENIPGGLSQINYRVRAKTTNGVLSVWTSPVPFFFGTSSGGPSSSAEAASQAESDGPDGLTIEDAQQLKDAQTAKGKPQAG